MKRLYLLCFDPMGELNISVLFNFLNNSPDILNWRTPGLPGMVILVSRLNVFELGRIFQKHMNHYHKFLLAEINQHNIEGWLPQSIWDFITNPPEAPPRITGMLAGILEHKKD